MLNQPFTRVGTYFMYVTYLLVLFLYLKEFERRERMDQPILVHDFKLQNKRSIKVSPVLVLKVWYEKSVLSYYF